MKSDPSSAGGVDAIVAAGVGKRYRLYATPRDRLLAFLPWTRPPVEVHALRDVTVTVPRGGTLGIVGDNGAGKSTLLRIFSGITTPTDGTCHIAGRVGSLLELGAGFHPDFTGRQNIRLSAALNGLDAADVEDRTATIIEFSELGDFIDQPVRRYSSGMVVRLGFSIAVQTRPDVLIVDEALSVGDGRFQKKGLDRILAFLDSGGTLVFASHALYYVAMTCARTIWLEAGRVEAIGPSAEVTAAYQQHLDRGRPAPLATGHPQDPAGPRLISIRCAGGRAPDGDSPARRYRRGDAWHVDIAWRATARDQGFHLAVVVASTAGVEICTMLSSRDGRPPMTGALEHRARLTIPDLPLIGGVFSLHVYLGDEHGLHVYDRSILSGAFRVESDWPGAGLLPLPHEWTWTTSP